MNRILFYTGLITVLMVCLSTLVTAFYFVEMMPLDTDQNVFYGKVAKTCKFQANQRCLPTNPPSYLVEWTFKDCRKEVAIVKDCGDICEQYHMFGQDIVWCGPKELSSRW